MSNIAPKKYWVHFGKQVKFRKHPPHTFNGEEGIIAAWDKGYFLIRMEYSGIVKTKNLNDLQEKIVSVKITWKKLTGN